MTDQEKKQIDQLEIGILIERCAYQEYLRGWEAAQGDQTQATIHANKSADFKKEIMGKICEVSK